MQDSFWSRRDCPSQPTLHMVHISSSASIDHISNHNGIAGIARSVSYTSYLRALHILCISLHFNAWYGVKAARLANPGDRLDCLTNGQVAVSHQVTSILES